MPIKLTDNPSSNPGRLSSVHNIPVIIKASDDHPHSAGSKTIDVINYDGKLSNAIIGTAYCVDSDDLWDINNKRFTKIDGDPSFR